MIGSFRCRDTQALFEDRAVRRFAAFEKAARRKLLMLHAATLLDDLLLPPGNRLEALQGDRKGQHSVHSGVVFSLARIRSVRCRNRRL